MPVLVGFLAFRPASCFVTGDTDAARNPARFIPAAVGSKAKKSQHMTDISRIKSSLEFLKDNQTFKVGELVLYHKDNTVFVTGYTNYNDLKNVNKRIALGELEDTKAEFKDYMDLVPEFLNFMKNKQIVYSLNYDYGMGSIIICREINSEIKWEQQLSD